MEQATALFQAAGIQRIRKLERNLFEVEVIVEDRIADVEILLGQRNIRSANCPCNRFSGKQVCVHIVTAFFGLRHALISSPASAIARTDPQSEPKILLRNVLELVDEQALKKFVANQGRKNRALNVLLRATFLDRLELDPPHNKYALLMEDLVRLRPDGSLDLPRRDLRILRDVVDSFLVQYDWSLRQQAFRTCLDIMTGLLTHLQIAYAKTTDAKTEISELLHGVYPQFTAFFHAQMAPELQYEALEYALTLLEKSTYVPPSFEQNIVQSIAAQVTGLPDARRVTEALIKHITSADDERLLWFALALTFAHRQNDRGLMHNLLEGHTSHQLEDQIRLVPLLQFLAARKEEVTILEIYKVISNQISQHPDQTTIYRIINEAADQAGDMSLFFTSGIQLFLRNENQFLLEQLADIPDEESNGAILHAINLVGDQERRSRLRCQYFATQKDFAGLMREIVDNSRPTLFYKYAAVLLQPPNPIIDTYLQELTMNFVENHIGQQSSTFVERINEILLQNERRVLWENIAEELRITFPERISLARSLGK